MVPGVLAYKPLESEKEPYRLTEPLLDPELAPRGPKLVATKERVSAPSNMEKIVTGVATEIDAVLNESNVIVPGAKLPRVGEAKL